MAIGLYSFVLKRIKTSAGMKKSADAFLFLPGKESEYAELSVKTAAVRHLVLSLGLLAFSIYLSRADVTLHIGKLTVLLGLGSSTC